MAKKVAQSRVGKAHPQAMKVSGFRVAEYGDACHAHHPPRYQCCDCCPQLQDRSSADRVVNPMH